MNYALKDSEMLGIPSNVPLLFNAGMPIMFLLFCILLASIIVLFNIFQRFSESRLLKTLKNPVVNNYTLQNLKRYFLIAENESDSFFSLSFIFFNLGKDLSVISSFLIQTTTPQRYIIPKWKIG